MPEYFCWFEGHKDQGQSITAYDPVNAALHFAHYDHSNYEDGEDLTVHVSDGSGGKWVSKLYVEKIVRIRHTTTKPMNTV